LRLQLRPPCCCNNKDPRSSVKRFFNFFHSRAGETLITQVWRVFVADSHQEVVQSTQSSFGRRQAQGTCTRLNVSLARAQSVCARVAAVAYSTRLSMLTASCSTLLLRCSAAVRTRFTPTRGHEVSLCSFSSCVASSGSATCVQLAQSKALASSRTGALQHHCDCSVAAHE
jgi:hypothetical protein